MEFLNSIVPEDSVKGLDAPVLKETQAARRQLFKMRSDLTHGRDILSMDSQNLSFTSMTFRETYSYVYALVLSKLALVNWLRTR